MLCIDTLAKQYLAFEKSDTSDFQRKARILQSMWREEKGYKPGVFRGRELGSSLPMPWAKETLANYLSDNIQTVVRDEVINSADNGKLYGKPRIYNNLLSSQPLCFNLFAELKMNMELASKVFTKLCPSRIEHVTAIEFEHSPGRGDQNYTGDRSAFDVFVEYQGVAGNGFIGIEVKYHESLKNKPAEMRDKYYEIASAAGCFKDDCIDRLQTSPLEQIWRDHLLACSMLNAGDYSDGFFVFLSPQGNSYCQDAVQEYQRCLTDAGTFESWNLEQVAETIQDNTEGKWIDDVIDRYLNFGKVDAQL